MTIPVVRMTRCVARWRVAAALVAVAAAVLPAASAAGASSQTAQANSAAMDPAAFLAKLSPAQRTALANGPLRALLQTPDLPGASLADARAPWTPTVVGAAATMPAVAAAPLRPLGSGPHWQTTHIFSSEAYDGVIPLETPTGNFHAKTNAFRYLAGSDDTLVGFGMYETRSPLFPYTADGAQLGGGKLHFYEKRDGEWQRTQTLDLPPDFSAAIQAYSDETGSFTAVAATSGDTTFLADPYLDEVVVYRRIAGAWQQTQVLSSGLGADAGASFGLKMALQGHHALIAAPTENAWSGAVYAYEESGGVWTQTQRLALDGNPPYALFGGKVAVDGSTAFVSATNITFDNDGNAAFDPVVHAQTLDASSGQWSAVQDLRSCGLDSGGTTANFGLEMALEGDTAVVGDTYGSVSTATGQTGIACVFNRLNGTWAMSQVLTPDDGVAGALFGSGVALKGDLVTISSYHTDVNASGNWDSGALYLYTRGASGWAFADELLLTAKDYNGAVWRVFGNDDEPMWFFSDTFSIVGHAVIGVYAQTGTGYGGFAIFDLPAQATAAPDALTLSLAAGGHTSATLHLGNAGAGHTLGFELSDGGTLTQTSEDTPVAGMGVSNPLCRRETANGWPDSCVEVIGTKAASWYRRFYFGDHPQVGSSATIDAVTVGIEGAPAGIPVKVRLYTKPHDDDAVDTLDPYDLVLIGEGSAVADGTPHGLLRIPVSGTVADTAHLDLVVEERVEEFAGMPAFVPGAIASPQTHSTFINYTDDYGHANYVAPGMAASDNLAMGSHILISPHLDPTASGIDCATPAATPWLSATPGSGRIGAGGTQDIAVTVDASSLAPGRYSTQLCFATKDPMPSLLHIPVQLTVLAPGDVIFQNGFDATQP